MAFLSRVALGVLCVSLFGCPAPKRLVFGPEGKITDAEALLKRLDAAEAQIRTLQGDAKLKVDSPQGSGSLGVYAAVSRPSSVHLEMMDFFGKVQSSLTCNADRFGLHQVGENAFYEGPATAENLSRFLPVLLPPAELTALMLGQVPRIAHERAELTVDDQEVAYKVTLVSGAVTQTLWVDTQTFRPVKSEIRGTRAYDLRLEDPDQVNGVNLSRRIILNAPAAKTTLDLRYKEISVNAPVDPGLFDLSPPPDVPVVRVDERGNALSTPTTK